MRLKLAPRGTLTLERGVTFDVMNTSWVRPFNIEQRLEVGTKRYYLCRFTQPDPDRSMVTDYEFMRFVAVHDTTSGITDVQNLTQRVGTPEEEVNLVHKGDGMLERFRCPGCHQYVRMRSRVLKRRVELIVTQYTCPKCGHQDVDYCD